MDHVVHTQLKLYSTNWLQSFEALFLYTWYRQLGFQVSIPVSEAVRLAG